MKRLFLICSIIFSAGLCAQPGFVPDDLQERLKDKTTLREFMKTVYQYYNLSVDNLRTDYKKKIEIDKKTFRALKHWNRWAYFMESRLGPNGELVDVNRMWMQNMPEQTTVSYGNWQLLGPKSLSYGHGRQLGIGRMDRIVFHPTDPLTFYVGSGEGGLWRTKDGGASYTCLTNNLPIIGVSGIVLDYQDTKTIYILTGNGDSGGLITSAGYRHSCIGVLKSTNGGSTWQQTGPLATGTYLGYKLVQSPTDPQTLLAATSQGVYRTDNGGVSWTLTKAGTFHDVAFRPGDGMVAYAVGRVNKKMRFYHSESWGQSWNPATFDFSIDNANRCSIGVSPANASVVFLTCGPGGLAGGTYTGCFRSVNDGMSFTRQGNTVDIYFNADGLASDQSGYDNCIAVKPDNINVIFTGGLVVCKSTNGGINFSYATEYQDGAVSESDTYIHPDVHAVAYNPLNNKLYACTDGGVFGTDNDGASWSRRYTGLAAAQIYHFDMWDGENSILQTGNQDNGIQSRYEGTTAFEQNAGGDGFDAEFCDKKSHSYVVLSTAVKQLRSNGLTVTDVADFAPNFFPPLGIHQSDDRILFIGEVGNARFHVFDFHGINDDDIFNIPASWYICPCPSNSNRIYLAGAVGAFDTQNGQLNRTDNLGSNPERLDDNFGFPDLSASGMRITGIAVNPSNSDNVWVCFGGFNAGIKVFRSLNGGDSWQDFSGSLPNLPVNSLAVDANNNVYAGTDNGVYYRGNGWVDWKPFYNGLPRVPVTEMHISTEYNNLYVSTFGRGIWASELYSDCVDHLDVSGKQEGQKFYESGQTMDVTSTSTGGVGTQVFYRAGDHVDLKEGFRVSSQSEARIYNGPCDSGIPDLLRMDSSETTDLSRFKEYPLPKQDEQKFPFAWIRRWSNKNGQFKAEIEQVREGEVECLLVNKDGKKVMEAYKGKTTGSSNFSVSLNGKTEAAYALLFYNDTMVHWQEIK